MKRVLSVILVCVLAMGCGFAGGLLGVKLGNQQTQPAEQEINVPLGDETETTNNVTIKTGSDGTTNISISTTEDVTVAEAIAAKVMPSVVGITTTYSVTSSYGDYSYFGFGGGGRSYSYDSSCVGTGFIVDEAGYILTNSHVVNDGDYKSIEVSLYDGSTVEGTVLWNDSVLDLAVVKVEAEGLVAAELGDSDTLRYGSYAAVIGNPLGLDFERSISQGIISGLNRTIEVSSDSSSSSTTMEGLIQTDATINSGNSGGPLLNSKGQVVGINSAKAASGEGMGFAIPINTAKPIVQQLKETGTFVRAYIGISGVGLSEVSGYTEEQLETQFGTSNGIYVASVNEGSGAEVAGLKKGDVIISVEGQTVNTMNRINTILIAYKVGDSVELTYMRNGETFTTSVVLSAGSTEE